MIPSKINGRQNPAYFKAYYERNRAKIREQQRTRYTRLGSRHYSVNNQDYKAMVISLLVERDGIFCWVCGKPMKKTSMTIDHVLQRAIGGTNDATNLKLAHRSCNAARPRPRRGNGTSKVK